MLLEPSGEVQGDALVWPRKLNSRVLCGSSARKRGRERERKLAEPSRAENQKSIFFLFKVKILFA